MSIHQKKNQSKKADEATFKKGISATQSLNGSKSSNSGQVAHRIKATANSLMASDVMRLQRLVGNQAVGRVLTSQIQRQIEEEESLQAQKEEEAQETNQTPHEGERQQVNIDLMIPFIEKWEGRQSLAYMDAKEQPCIGVGFNLERPDAKEKIEGLGVSFTEVLSGGEPLKDNQIDELLRPDIEAAIEEAEKRFDNFYALPLIAQMIVVDLMFTLQDDEIRDFTKPLKTLEQFDFATAADQMQDLPWHEEADIRARHHLFMIRSLAPLPAEAM